MRVAIVGASGYTGLELVRIVLRHPELELVAITSEQRDGLRAGDAFAGLRSLVELEFEKLDPASLAERVDAEPVIVPLYVGGDRNVDSYFQLVDLWVERLLNAAEKKAMLTSSPLPGRPE